MSRKLTLRLRTGLYPSTGIPSIAGRLKEEKKQPIFYCDWMDLPIATKQKTTITKYRPWLSEIRIHSRHIHNGIIANPTNRISLLCFHNVFVYWINGVAPNGKSFTKKYFKYIRNSRRIFVSRTFFSYNTGIYSTIHHHDLRPAM